MASSDSDMSFEHSSPPDDQTQFRNQSLPFLLPLILGLATAAPPQDGENRTVSERFVLVHPLTGALIMIDGLGSLELSSKDGRLPASKASIEAMPVVKVVEEGLECAICLGEYEVGGVAKEMPCKHRYHSDCIEKWLGMHGSCPVCRYNMPVEEGEEKKKGGDGTEGENGARRAEREIQISFFVRGGGDRTDSNSSPESGSDDDSVATDESSTQDVEIEID
ncbi:unnamed protein product [Camellia sinensis]